MAKQQTKAELTAKLAALEAVSLTERNEADKLAALSQRRWALLGVVVMSILSAALNGYANANHSSSPMASWAIGIAIPAIILILGRVAGLAQQRGQRTLAYATASAGIGLLTLSVWHCAVSIAALTGSHVALAVPMAIAIDVGFVCCEYATMDH